MNRHDGIYEIQVAYQLAGPHSKSSRPAKSIVLPILLGNACSTAA